MWFEGSENLSWMSKDKNNKKTQQWQKLLRLKTYQWTRMNIWTRQKKCHVPISNSFVFLSSISFSLFVFYSSIYSLIDWRIYVTIDGKYGSEIVTKHPLKVFITISLYLESFFVFYFLNHRKCIKPFQYGFCAIENI